MSKYNKIITFLISLVAAAGSASAGEISYQGRISKNNEEGGIFDQINGYFKFAIVDSTGEITYWRNDTPSADGGEPSGYVVVPFPDKNGIFQVSLGSRSMAPIGPAVFNNPETYLRIWFSPDGANFEQLLPDEKLSAVAYSFHSKVAETVLDGALGLEKLSNDFTGMTLVSGDANDTKLKEKGFVRFGQISSQPWVRANPEDEPSPVKGHSTVAIPNSEDGIVMVVWGGAPGEGFFSDMGWAYDSKADRWTMISPVDAPSKRVGHTGVFYGEKMMIWGGLGPEGYRNDGGIYNFSRDKWTPVTPGFQTVTARTEHSSSVVSGKVIVWGGRNEFNIIGDGATYDIESGEWKTVSGLNSPAARTRHTASVYQDRLVIVFGGESSGFFGDGVVYDVKKEVWAKLVSDTEGPEPRAGHTAIMVNDRLIIWGGIGNDGLIGDGYIFSFDRESTNFQESGAEVTGEWVKLPTEGQPSPRIGHTANWTGSEMIIFGGETNFGETNTGFAYDPSKTKWRSLTTRGGALKRSLHTAEWTGSQLVIFGGVVNKIRISETQLLDTQGTWHLYRKL